MVRAAIKLLAEHRAKGDQTMALMSAPELLHMTATRTNMSKADDLDFISDM
jgi:hypothetical protein